MGSNSNSKTADSNTDYSNMAGGQLAEMILASPRSTRRQLVDINGNLLHLRLHSNVLRWGAVGTRHSYFENPTVLVAQLSANVFNFGDAGSDTYYVSFHTHIMESDTDSSAYSFAKTGVRRYGAEKFYTLASLGDLSTAVTSLDHNNRLGQIHFGGNLNAKEMGIGVGVVGCDGKMRRVGFLDLDALGRDDRAAKVVLALVDKKLAAEKNGEKYRPYEDEVIPVLDQIAKYTLDSALPDWIDQNSSVSMPDTNMTSMRGADRIFELFQESIDLLPEQKWMCEIGMLGISTQRDDKIDTLVTPMPRVLIPGAKEVLRGFSKPGIPEIRLAVDEKTHGLCLYFDCGRDVEIARGLYKGGKTSIPLSDVLLVDGGWETYVINSTPPGSVGKFP